jgi:hypothetical protein
MKKPGSFSPASCCAPVRGAADNFRIDSLWRLREQGLNFPGKRIKAQEYILWRRVAVASVSNVINKSSHPSSIESAMVKSSTRTYPARGIIGTPS